MSHYNQLTPGQAERLAVLAEECGEVIQVVGKILRHGYESRHPDGGPTNRELLEAELGDVEAVLSMLATRRDVSTEQIAAHMQAGAVRKLRYMHHISA